MNRTRESHCLWGIGLLLVVPCSALLWAQQEAPPPAIDIYGMARAADFIFKGKVVNVQYRNSERVQAKDPSGKPIYEGTIPVLVDGSNLPYTFVTYGIERIYKGKAPAGSPLYVTLRIVGGVDTEKPGEIVEVPDFPHMDPDDRDVLFVRRNTINECPLVQSEWGRFRVILPGYATTRLVFTDRGHQIVRVAGGSQGRDEADVGPYEELPEVLTHSFANCSECKLETVVEEPGNEFELPNQDGGDPEWGQARGPQFAESQFDVFLDYVVAQTHTPSELQNLPPVVSADITKPFYGPELAEVSPKPLPTETPFTLPRPWLDQLPAAKRNAILEAERREAELLELNGGDPVLPSTPCEMRILTDGAIPGDITGPGGRPDCYVNMYDLAGMARSWLSCVDPLNAACGQ